MTDDVLVVTVRAANAGYLLRYWHADCSPDAGINDTACRRWLQNGAVMKEVESRILAPGYEE